MVVRELFGRGERVQDWVWSGGDSCERDWCETMDRSRDLKCCRRVQMKGGVKDGVKRNRRVEEEVV